MGEPRVVNAIVTKPPYRRTIEWARLFGEGSRMDVQGYQSSTLVEDFDDRDAVVVMMVRVPRDKVAAVKQHGTTLLDVAAWLAGVKFPGIVPWLMGGR